MAHPLTSSSRDFVRYGDGCLEEDVASFEFLLQRQTNLRHIAFTGDRSMLERVAAKFPALRTLDLYDNNIEQEWRDPGRDVDSLSSLANCPKLERLSLLGSFVESISEMIWSLRRGDHNENSKSALAQITTLNLGCHPYWGRRPPEASSLLSGFAFDSITSLTIWDDPVPHLYTLLGTSHAQVGLKFRHLCVPTAEGLLSVLKLCDDLRSLHLFETSSWEEEPRFLEELHRLGRSLLALSYHKATYDGRQLDDPEEGSSSLTEEPLGAILERCPGLTQLSYYISGWFAPVSLALANK